MLIKTEKIEGRIRNRSIKDHSGIKYNRLTAIRLIERKENKRHVWEFKCDCGATVNLAVNRVAMGKTKSCGCLLNEVLIERNTTHGLSRSHWQDYRTWKDMRSRCYNTGDSDYRLYGERGIRVCDRWSDFSVFLADMGRRPKGYTIDRIDVNGHYEPSNCRWATSKTQANNKRTNNYIEHNGVMKTLQGWCEEYGISHSKARYRLSAGMSFEEVFSDKDFRVDS